MGPVSLSFSVSYDSWDSTQTDASSLGSHLSASTLLSLAPSLSLPLFLTPLISRAERLINDPRYWLFLLQVQTGVDGNPVQNQGVLGGSKALIRVHISGLYKPQLSA